MLGEPRQARSHQGSTLPAAAKHRQPEEAEGQQGEHGGGGLGHDRESPRSADGGGIPVETFRKGGEIQGREAAGNVFRRFPGVVRGDPWFSGDHMIFVQGGVPCLAFTSEHAQELMRTVHHTSSDTPDIVECERLVELASALDGLVRAL